MVKISTTPIEVPKLPKKYAFFDLSDYGRIPARIIAESLKSTNITPIHITIWFVISGLIAIYCMIIGNYICAALFLILKSILDAADGELARVKQKPSYTGRYLDSISDIILNFLIVATIWFISDTSIYVAVMAFLGIQLQGTLYNYYYVILRTNVKGDNTSQVFEEEAPVALKGEKQRHVDFLFNVYKLLYGGFDRIIYTIDREAPKSSTFPKWFMTPLSVFGLGFQLLMISIFLVAGLKDIILPFFALLTLLIFVFVGIRKYAIT